MLRSIFSFLICLLAANSINAQTQQELERQRAQLRKEIEETQKLLNNTTSQTKENLTRLALIRNKAGLQERVVGTISKDLHILDNNIYTIQRDVNRYDRLLDTLKQEYAKSMVYAYKNRGNYEFLNFIFSADNFNDAIKRMSYLRSYRTFREMQGQNILRTQELRRKRLEDLGVSKQKKNSTLQVQSKEMAELEAQKQEQNKIVVALQKNAKKLNESLSAKKKQAAKINNLIAKAIKAARDEAIAKAKAAEEINRLANIKKANDVANANKTGTKAPAVTSSRPVKKAAAAPESVLLNSENTALNTSFERNKGSLPWPVDRGSVVMHYGTNKMENGGTINVVSVTIAADQGSSVKAVFDGTVALVQDDIIVLQHGRYFTTYSNLSGISVRKGDAVKTGQAMGRVSLNEDGIGAIDFQASDERNNFDPEKWLRRR